jgi:predicted nucleic acid-binding protein
LGALDSLRNRTVALDTSPFIYFIEQHPLYVDSAREVFRRIEAGEFIALASVVTLLEVLVHPYRKGDAQLVQRYREILLDSPRIRTLPVDNVIAEEAARLRSTLRIRVADAIQLATAAVAGAEVFLTNDAELPKIRGLKILLMADIS